MIRTRFAPSPTGHLHIGGARTALFCYLFAKQNNGQFILRIEDTDQERSEENYTKGIIEGLKWLGLDWDEGPYFQTERKEIYRRYLEKLLEEGRAYRCFCTKEEIESQRQYYLSQGEAPRYNGKCSNMPLDEQNKLLEEGRSFIVRLRAPKESIKFNDLVKGEIEFPADTVGDISLSKGMDQPLYNFAVVVDDYEMKISHVVRGEDHIPNTPKQIAIAQALGLPLPEYGHLPLILGPDRSKMSKRHGATAVIDYQQQGFLPEAFINFIAMIGWNPGDNREIFSLEELTKEFSWSKVQKGGGIFNIQKLEYINGYYIRQLTTEKLSELLKPWMTEKSREAAVLYQDRLKRLDEIKELADFLITEPVYEKDLLIWKQMTLDEVKESLSILCELLESDNWETVIMERATAMGDRGRLLWPLRAALTGKKQSAGPMEVIKVIGTEKAIERLKKAICILS